jgi:hypothetical protein
MALRVADGTRDPEDEPMSGLPKKTDLMGSITKQLREEPFTSCKAICWRVKTPKTVRFRVLHEELGLIKLYFHWIPHALDANQMTERVTLWYQLQ